MNLAVLKPWENCGALSQKHWQPGVGSYEEHEWGSDMCLRFVWSGPVLGVHCSQWARKGPIPTDGLRWRNRISNLYRDPSCVLILMITRGHCGYLLCSHVGTRSQLYPALSVQEETLQKQHKHLIFKLQLDLLLEAFPHINNIGQYCWCLIKRLVWWLRW